MIATEWKEFKEIDWETVYAGMNKPAFIFDGRLLLDAEKLRKIGFHVRVYFIIFLRFLILMLCLAGYNDWTTVPQQGLTPITSRYSYHFQQLIRLCTFPTTDKLSTSIWT